MCHSTPTARATWRHHHVSKSRAVGPVEHQPVIYLITGPVAAGKSTVGRLIASRLGRGVHLDGDVFRRSIVSGRVEMTPDPPPEALEQLRQRHRLAAAVADGYFEAGFSVVLEDVVSGPMLGDYRTMIRSRPCHVVVLVPSLETVVARAAGRDQRGYGARTVEQLYEAFVSQRPRVGLWLDTTSLTPEETAAEILARTTSIRSPIVVTGYDDEWPRIYEEVARPIRDAVADLGAEVEHIGSTSVPALAAKPIIDVDVIVRSADDVHAAIERLRALGYVYQGDKGIRAGRRSCGRPARPSTISTSSFRGAAPTSITSGFATTCAITRKWRSSTRP